MSHTPTCVKCGIKHFNFKPCPPRKGNLQLAHPFVAQGFGPDKPWGSEPLPDDLGLWPPKENVRHLPRVPQDFGPRAA